MNCRRRHARSWQPSIMVMIGALATALAAYPCLAQENPASFQVIDTTPKNGAVEVELDPLIQIHVSRKFDPKTLNDKAVALVNAKEETVTTHLSGDLGGVVTLSLDEPLLAGSEYRIRVGRSLRSLDGASIEPTVVRFRTVARPTTQRRENIADFQFEKVRIDQRDGVCGLATAPGGALFACTWDGQLVRYALQEDGTVAGRPQVLLQRKRRFNAIVADPKSSDEEVILWLSHDSQHRLSLGPNDFSGTISRLTIRGDDVQVQDVVTGLPTGDHPASGLVFGPDGRLFVSQGALSMLGGKATLPETSLSAATLAIDLQHVSLRKAKPLDVRDFRYEDTKKDDSALEVFATGIREAFDLCWHSNGNLYAGVNMNDTDERTPESKDLPAVNVRPTEMMLRIVSGKYYGHPNPARDEWVLLGGNPTSGVDPWEISSLPVGTKPEQNFDPALLIRNLEKDKGSSADGVCEWTGDGPLQGRLLFCFYTATRGIHTYELSDDGTKVTDHQPLVDERNQPLRFGAPLDVVFDERGWLHVADFSAAERGDSGKEGGIWLVRPIRVDVERK